MSKEITYTEAFEKLQTVVQELEGAEISIDELSDKIRYAKELLEICQTKLNKVEEDVDEILAEMK